MWPKSSFDPSTYYTPWKTETQNSTLACPPDEESLILFYIFFSPIFVTGLLGNGMIMLIFFRHREMRSAPNTLLLNLAVADFITMIICCTGPLFDSIDGSLRICQVLRTVMETSMHTSGYTLIALSAERYLAIVHPFQCKSSSREFIHRAVLLTWFSSATMSVVKPLLQAPSSCQKCVRMYDLRDFGSLYSIVWFLISYLIPLCLISTFYVLMAKKLYLSGRSLPEENTRNVPLAHQLSKRKRIALVVLLLVIAYAFCFLPYHVFSLRIFFIDDLAKSQDLAPLIAILYCIGCTHNSLDPIVLYTLSKEFKRYFKYYLFCCISKAPLPIFNNTSSTYRNRSYT